MKYIIDVPDEGKYRLGQAYIFANDGERIVASCNLTDLTPYTEPDREAIENEVWDFVSKLVWSFGDKEILGMGIAHAVRDMTYQEAKARYEAWKNQKELRMGDEVILPDKTKGIVMDRDDDDCIVINKDSYTIVYHVSELRNTGRHYDCIINLAEVLKRYRDAV